MKFQSLGINGIAVICKNSENLEKFEVRYSDIRVVENHSTEMRIIHAKYQTSGMNTVALIA